MSTEVIRPQKRRKRDYQCSVRLNISLPPSLDEVKDQLVTKFRYGNFSDYIQGRMRKDLGLDHAA